MFRAKSSDSQEKDYAVFTGQRTQKKYVGVAINFSGGAFGLSTKAMEIYSMRAKQPFDEHRVKRTDRVMIDVIQELGTKEAAGPTCTLQIKLLPWEFREHYKLYESEGYEGVELEINAQKLDTIKYMMTQPISSDGHGGGREPKYVTNFKQSVVNLIEDEHWEDYSLKDLDELYLAGLIH